MACKIANAAALALTVLATGLAVHAAESQLPATAAGTARLNCQVSKTGELSACKLATETPRRQGFGDRALALAVGMKIEPQIKDGQPFEGEVIVPFTFEEGALRPMNGASTEGEGMQRPTPRQIMEVYPERALYNGRAGTVRLKCDVTTVGALLNCSVASETPERQGFGAAALKLAPLFKMRPRFENGVPISGTVILPINFQPPTVVGVPVGTLRGQ